MRYYKKAFKVDKENNLDIFLKKGDELHSKKDYNNAIRYYEEAIKRNS